MEPLSHLIVSAGRSLLRCTMQQAVLLVDTHHQIYRSFFALPSLLSPTGEPVNAVYGIFRMLRKWLEDTSPTHAAAVFDSGQSARHLAIMPTYKERRPAMPSEMVAQIPLIREMLQALSLPIVEVDGYEADDIIATLAREGDSKGAQVFIASNDKDFAQLVGPNIRCIRSERQGSQMLDAAAVVQHYGVSPSKIIDFLSLTGDAVDGIPGVPGIGEKTAIALLNEFGDLENLLANIMQLPKPRLRSALESSVHQLRINHQLIRLKTDVELGITLDELMLGTPDHQKLRDLSSRVGFPIECNQPRLF
jgi:DNA polymerase-1